MEKITSKSMYIHAKEAIVGYIRDNAPGDKPLPSEAHFAKMLGVSRNTVREAIRILEREGVVYSRHGVGTFVVDTGQRMSSNIAILCKHSIIIDEHGYAPGTIDVAVQTLKADKRLAALLALEPGRLLHCVEGVRTADGEPVIYVRDYLAYHEELADADRHFDNETMFLMLETQFGIKIGHSVCGIKAVVADGAVRAKLRLGAAQALLQLEQTHFSNKGEPVLYSDSWFVSDKFNFNVVRRPI